MRIYITSASDYLEMGEVPSFDYESNLFKFTDFSLSRSVDMTLPRSKRNDRVLAHASNVSQVSTVIDGKHEAVLCGKGVQVKGTLYITEVTPDGYEATFTYGDADGLQALDVNVGDAFDPGTDISLTLASGEVSASASTPAELSPMVCMDYSVNLEASQDEYGTGFSSADMNCVMYSSSRGVFIALGNKEGWTSADGVTWEQVDSAVIKRYTWYALEEDSGGNIIAAGRTSAGYMVVACASSNFNFTLCYTATSNTSVKERLATYQNGAYVAATDGSIVAVFVSGQWTRDLSAPVTGWSIHWLGGSGNLVMALTSEYTISGTTYAGFTANLATGLVTYRGATYIGTTASLMETNVSSLRNSNPNHSFYYHDNTSLNTESDECVYSTGSAWTKILEASMYAMAYGGGYYVGVGADGETWYGTSYSSLTEGGSCGEQSLHSVAYNNSTWVAVGDVGALYYSTDHGVTWSAGTAVVSVKTTGFAPMPCVNLLWLTYQGIKACGLTPVFSDSAKALAPYLYIMLSQCVDGYGLEVSEGATCYLRHNMPDMTVLELLELTCSITGEMPYVDGTNLKFFDYDFSSSSRGTYDVGEWVSVIHAVTDSGAQSNDITLSVPDSDEDKMADDTGRIWSFATPNATLDDSNELYSGDVSTGASDGGILQVTNVEIDADEDDDGNVTYEITREGDLTLCWYDGGNGRMMYVGDQTLTTRMKWAGLANPAGVRRLSAIYADALTYTTTLEMGLPRFMEMAFDDMIAMDGAAFCVTGISWSDGMGEATLVRIPRDNISPVEKSSYKITVAVSPTEGGTATGGGTYQYGTEVTLTATAATGYVFKSWSDGAMGSTRTVTVTGKATYTAYFEKEKHTILVSSSPTEGGLVSGGGTYEYGDSVTLTATAATGYVFRTWLNDGYGNATRTITVTEDATYTAYFEKEKFTITAVSDPLGAGVVSGGGTYEYGTEVTLTATPATGYVFRTWLNDGYSNATRTITVTEDAVYTAYFELEWYSITVAASPSYGGHVTGYGYYEYGSTATLTATPAEHYELYQWSDGDTTTPRTITVTEDATYIAYFALKKYTITVVADPSGDGVVSGGGSYTYGDTVTLSATPSTGHTFDGWSSGETTTSITIEVTGDATYTAYFGSESYEIKTVVSPSGGGTVDGWGWYDYGDTATLSATPADHYVFSQWSNGETTRAILVEVTENATYTAYFELASYTITTAVSPSGGGIVSGGGTYTYGSVVTLSAFIYANYEFEQWSNGDENSSITITVTGNATYTAYFKLASYTITTEAFPSAGGRAIGGGTYEYGSTATIYVRTLSGYKFVQWNDGDTTTPRDITVTGDATYTAYFERNAYLVSATPYPSSGGLVAGVGYHDYGSTATLVAMPNTGYYFDSWGDGDYWIDDSDTSATRSLEVTGNINVAAYFEAYSYTITAVAEPLEGGAVEGGGTYEYGSSTELTAIPSEGYTFSKWSSGATTESITVYVKGDATYTAYFEADTYKIATGVSPSGSGTTTGGGTYQYGDTATLTASAAVGYTFVRWSDGNASSTRTITVTRSASYIAYFEQDMYTISVGASPSAGGTVTGTGAYHYGQLVKLTATAASGYNFVRWNDGVTTTTRTITVTADTTYTAYFEETS